MVMQIKLVVVLFCARHPLLNFILSELQALFKWKYGVHTM